ncbi:MAG: phosphotransferase [Myxococcota bacterium]
MSFTAIAAQIAPDARLVRSWPLKGGVSAHVEALELEHPDGRLERVVVRRHGAAEWKPLLDDVTTAEHGVLSALQTEGLPVPGLRLLDASNTLLPTPYLVMDFVEGTIEVPDGPPDTVIEQMASFLLRLHGLDVATLALPRLEHRHDPVPELLEWLGPDRSLLRAQLDAQWSGPRSYQPSLLHGDYWSGNVLWKDEVLISVIDWEDAAVGDPLSDLACSRIEFLWKHGRDAMERFTLAYGGTPDALALGLWDLYVGTSAAITMGEWGLEPDVEATMRARTVTFLNEAEARVLDAFQKRTVT